MAHIFAVSAEVIKLPPVFRHRMYAGWKDVVCRGIGHGQSIIKSINQSINHSINQQPASQPNNQSIKHANQSRETTLSLQSRSFLGMSPVIGHVVGAL